MKVFKYVLPVGVLLALILTGCSEIETRFADAISTSNHDADHPAVLLASTTQRESLFDLIFSAGNRKSNKHTKQKFAGTDPSRPLVACIWVAENGTPKPIIYVPVTDYEVFLNGLAKKFPVRRAIASKFSNGQRQFVVMEGAGHAKIAPSLEAAKASQDSPENLLSGLPMDDDVVLKWNPAVAGKKHAKKLLKSIQHFLGDSFENVLNLDSSLVCSFDLNKERKSGINVRLDQVSGDANRLRSQLEENFEVENWSVADAKNGELLFRINELEGAEQQHIAKDLQFATSKLFKSHISALAKRKSLSSNDATGSTLGRLSSLVNFSTDDDSNNPSAKPRCNPTKRRR